MQSNSRRSTLQQGQGFAAFTEQERKTNQFKQTDRLLYLELGYIETKDENKETK